MHVYSILNNQTNKIKYIAFLLGSFIFMLFKIKNKKKTHVYDVLSNTTSSSLLGFDSNFKLQYDNKSKEKKTLYNKLTKKQQQLTKLRSETNGNEYEWSRVACICQCRWNVCICFEHCTLRHGASNEHTHTLKIKYLKIKYRAFTSFWNKRKKKKNEYKLRF